jgi:ammonium transporter Rh
MVGTVFLWCFWPSFNGVLAAGDAQHRVVINTVIALCGSCAASFVVSGLLRKGNRFSAVDIQNATLAGGVAVGSSADLVIAPGGALLTGLVAGVMCVVGFTKIQPWLATKGLHDTCGVLNLHGLSGVIGGIGGAISSAMVSDTVYGQQVGNIFPARAPVDAGGKGRSAEGQAGIQLLGVACSFLVPIVGGLITGFVMKLNIFLPGQSSEALFDDAKYWDMEEEVVDAKPESMTV